MATGAMNENEVAFPIAMRYQKVLKQNKRLDGRSFTTFRKPNIVQNIFSKCHGSASIRLGNSYYLISIQGSLSTPGSPSPSEYLIFDLDQKLDSTSTSFSFNLDFIESFQQLLNNPNVIDPKVFQIDSKHDKLKAYWVGYIKIVCLEYDGNANDAIVLGCLAAIQDTVFPAVVWNQDTHCWDIQSTYNMNTSSTSLTNRGLTSLDQSITENEEYVANQRITFVSYPMCLSFCHILDTFWVLDPTREEEELGSTLTLYNLNSKWHLLHQGGREIIPGKLLKQIQPVSKTVMTQFQSILENANKTAASK